MTPEQTAAAVQMLRQHGDACTAAAHELSCRSEAIAILRDFDAWMSSMWEWGGCTQQMHPDAPALWRRTRELLETMR